MIRASRAVSVVIVAAVAFTGCTSSSDTTTTSAVEPITTLAPSTTTTTEPTTTTTLAPITELSAPSYRIVERTPTDGPGDEVVVLLDPSSYDSLTDLDVYDVIAEVVELFPPVAIVHVVDAPAAANIVANPVATEEERVAAAPNYLARLDDGFRITYLGPFASSGTAVLGS